MPGMFFLFQKHNVETVLSPLFIFLAIAGPCPSFDTSSFCYRFFFNCCYDFCWLFSFFDLLFHKQHMLFNDWIIFHEFQRASFQSTSCHHVIVPCTSHANKPYDQSSTKRKIKEIAPDKLLKYDVRWVGMDEGCSQNWKLSEILMDKYIIIYNDYRYWWKVQGEFLSFTWEHWFCYVYRHVTR